MLHMNSGDTAWMLISTALVVFMVPGLAFFYGGMVRSKNVLGMLMQNIFAMGLIAVIWVLIAFSLAYRLIPNRTVPVRNALAGGDAAVQALLTTAIQGFRQLQLVTAGDAFASYSSAWEDGSTAVAEKSASVVVWAGMPVAMAVNVDPISTGEFGQRVGTITYTIDDVTKKVSLTLDDPLEDPGPWWRLSHPFG